MADTPTILYGPSRLTLPAVTAEVLVSLLRRLPAALWNQSPDDPTPQRELSRVLAEQMALHLENRTVLQAMHLLLEAEGLDLDALLADLGLRRFLQRPDAYAREVGMACLFRVKATMRALEHLAELLLDVPHLVLQTGQAEVNILIAESAPITTPTSYWTLSSREGTRYAVTVQQGLGWLGTQPPPGLDTTPAGTWLAGAQIAGDDSSTWYLTVEGDTMVARSTPPDWGPTAPGYTTLDGQGTRWTFRVLTALEVLEPVVLATGQPPAVVLDPAHPFQTLHLLDEGGTPRWLWVTHDGVFHVAATAPAGAVDVTPVGGPYRWLRLYGASDSLWYGSPLATNAWVVNQTHPGGLGTNAVQELGDPVGTVWRLGVTPGGTFVASNTPRVNYHGLSTAVLLRDRFGKGWYWRVKRPGPIFEVADTLWPETVVAQPWGSLSWLAVPSTAGGVRYVTPLAYLGYPHITTAPPGTGPWGWTTALPLYDNTGQAWTLVVHQGVLHYELSGASLPPVRPPALDVRDLDDATRYVRPAGCQMTLYVS